MAAIVITGSCAATIPASPAAVFERITDLGQLPAWNRRMLAVVSTPPELVSGAEWVVRFRVLGRTWDSRSVVEEIDRSGLHFSYRAATDDGNPSRAMWRWDVAEAPGGSRATVRWELRPVTFWRRTLLGRVRAYQLAHQEVPASLLSLTANIATARQGAA